MMASVKITVGKMKTTGWEAAVAVLLPFVGSLIWQIVEFKRKDVPNWYDKLRKPDWRPSKRLFPIIWTILYASMGWASYLVWRDGGGFTGPAKLPLILYAVELFLNWLYLFIFFVAHDLRGSVIVASLLTITTAACVFTFGQICQLAMLFMLPYLMFITFDTYLGYHMWCDNTPVTKTD